MKELEQNILNSTPPDISNLTSGLRKIGARTHWSYIKYGYVHAVPDNARSEVPENARNIRLIKEGDVLFKSSNGAQVAIHTHGRYRAFSDNVPFEWRPKASEIISLNKSPSPKRDSS